MKKLFTILFSLVAFISNAQNTLNNIGLTSSTPASVAYSLRLLSSSYAGPLVRIKVGSSFYDVYPDVSTTKFSLSSKISDPISTYNAAVAAAHASNTLNTLISGSTNATVAIWYDQSGNGVHVLSSTSTAQIITAGTVNTLNGQPTIYFSGSNGQSLLTSSNSVDYSALSGATVNAVAQNVATTSTFAGIIGAAYGIQNPGYNISYDATIGKGYTSDGAGCTYGTNLSSTNPQVVTNIFVNTTTNLSNTYINGVLKTSSGPTCSLTHTTGSKIYIGNARGYGPASFIGNISEAIIFPKQVSSGEQTLFETSQTVFYYSPLVTISSSAPNNTSCSGTSVTFTATPYNFTSTPTYQWYKNNVAISGETNASYTTSTLANADQIYVTASSVSSNSLSNTITAGPSAVITVSGDGCINKTTLSTPAGQSAYAWYKDNVLIPSATTNTYSPTTAGDYKVQVTSGTCSTMSAATTISVCGVTADGSMRPAETSSVLISREGATNNGYVIDERGSAFTKPVPQIAAFDFVNPPNNPTVQRTWTSTINGVTATIRGNPTYTSTNGGGLQLVSGSSIDINGINTATTSFTLSMVVDPPTNTNDHYNVFYDGNSGVRQGNAIWANFWGTTINVGINTEQGVNAGTPVAGITRYDFVYDGASVKVYKNASIVANGTIPVSNGGWSSNLRIGNEYGYDGNFFNGKIYRIKYQKTALDQSAITTQYNAEKTW